MQTVALIVAAGRGERFGAALPKQYACLGGIAGAASFNPGVCRPSRRSTPSVWSSVPTTPNLYGAASERARAAASR